MWFQFGKFCYGNYEQEQTGLKLQLDSPLKFLFLYAFSLATASRGNTFCLKSHFAAAAAAAAIVAAAAYFFTVIVTVRGQVVASILSQV